MNEFMEDFVVFAFGALAAHSGHSLYGWWQDWHGDRHYQMGWGYARHCYDRATKPEPERICCKTFAAGMQASIDDIIASGGANPAALVAMGISQQYVEHLIATRSKKQ